MTLLVCDGDCEAVDEMSSRNHCPIPFFVDVIIPLVSFTATAVFNFAFVMPDTHFPLSKWCNCADGQLKHFLHLWSARQWILLIGLCRTDLECARREALLLKFFSHFPHTNSRRSFSCFFDGLSCSSLVFLSFFT